MWWRKKLTPLSCLLLPFSWVFRLIVWWRRRLFASGKRAIHAFSSPVIVVGNISVGGNGKTPFVIWLAALLREAGYQPGIVSRGYGGKAKQYPVLVQENSQAQEVGDEALLLSLRTQCPVVIDPDRVAATRYLLSHTHTNIVISDDGLQHYALGRDIEIVMVDGERLFGNGQCLPAGPLREPVSRLKEADFVVSTGKPAVESEWACMELAATEVCTLAPWGVAYSVSTLPKDKPLHAVAAIGHPQRFFNTLKQLGLKIIEHGFRDHYLLTKKDIDYAGSTIIMTEKDAVKCRDFADARHYYLPVNGVLNETFSSTLLERVRRVLHG